MLPNETMEGEQSVDGAENIIQDNFEQSNRSVEIPTSDESAPPAPAPKPVEPQWNPQEWKMNYKGREFFPKDRNHLVQLAQRGYMYDQDQESVAKTKREIEEAKQKYSQYEALDAKLKDNPEFAQKLFAMAQESNGIVQDENMPPEIQSFVKQQTQVINKLQSEIADLKSKTNYTLERDADMKIKQEIDTLKSKYANNQWDADVDGNGTLIQRVIKHSLEKNFPTLEAAYRDYTYDSLNVNAQTEALRKQKESEQAAHKAGKVMGGGQGVPAQKIKGYDKKMDYNDLAAIASQELGG